RRDPSSDETRDRTSPANQECSSRKVNGVEWHPENATSATRPFQISLEVTDAQHFLGVLCRVSMGKEYVSGHIRVRVEPHVVVILGSGAVRLDLHFGVRQ